MALLASAHRTKANKPDHYLGAGILRAKDALSLDYAKVWGMENTAADRENNKKPHQALELGFSKSPRDYYDGERSGAQLLLPFLSQPAFPDRADLRQRPSFFSTRSDAIKNVLFNGFLLQKYEWARTPKKGKEEASIDAMAQKLAAKLDGLKSQ